MIRLSWTQPEDLVPHALVAARLDGIDVDDLAARWQAAGGPVTAPVTGATPLPAGGDVRTLGVELLTEIDQRPIPAALAAAEPDDLAAIERVAPGSSTSRERSAREGRCDTRPVIDPDRVHGAWVGRAAGCLLGKPVEKVGRAGIRAIADSTRNWPITSHFTALGLDPKVAAAHPWNRRSAVNSLAENIDGMPEDDDLNFPLVALGLVERSGEAITTDLVAQAWLDELPAGRVFTAERIAYRNLLSGDEPDVAAVRGNPFTDWIGAQIRTDMYGWVCPGQPQRAARLAWADARLSHRRNGVYGAMFVAAASATALVADRVDECIVAGLGVIPPDSRYAAAVRYGVELGRSGASDEAAIDMIYDHYGHLHWVHALNNSALCAFALTRSGGDFDTAITSTVSGGWDTDSNGATVGSICGALTGATSLPVRWIAPLRNRLASSVRGFDGIGFDDLAHRTVSARLS